VYVVENVKVEEIEFGTVSDSKIGFGVKKSKGSENDPASELG
jgi:hypothetical protein